jgi:hypothetical protein
VALSGFPTRRVLSLIGESEGAWHDDGRSVRAQLVSCSVTRTRKPRSAGAVMGRQRRLGQGASMCPAVRGRSRLRPGACLSAPAGRRHGERPLLVSAGWEISSGGLSAPGVESHCHPTALTEPRLSWSRSAGRPPSIAPGCQPTIEPAQLCGGCSINAAGRRDDGTLCPQATATARMLLAPVVEATQRAA